MSDSFLPAVTAGDGIAVERTVYGYRVHLDQESIPAAAASEPYAGYFKVIAAEEGGSVRIVDGSAGNTGAPAGYVYIDRRKWCSGDRPAPFPGSGSGRHACGGRQRHRDAGADAGCGWWPL